MGCKVTLNLIIIFIPQFIVSSVIDDLNKGGSSIHHGEHNIEN